MYCKSASRASSPAEVADACLKTQGGSWIGRGQNLFFIYTGY